jgi:hypothetical protein
MDNLRSFDEYLERKFLESRRKAHYLMAIHECLPKIPLREQLPVIEQARLSIKLHNRATYLKVQI